MRHWLSLLLLLAMPAAYATGKDYLTFDNTAYLHRWSYSGQHEFTPSGQENLEKWSDMITLQRYDKVNSLERLTIAANTVLEAYRKAGATILRVESQPAANDRPPEFLLVAVIPQSDMLEAVFSRFRLVNGVGTSTLYSHRLYGHDINDNMITWLKQNMDSRARLLMAWQPDTQAYQDR